MEVMTLHRTNRVLFDDSTPIEEHSLAARTPHSPSTAQVKPRGADEGAAATALTYKAQQQQEQRARRARQPSLAGGRLRSAAASSPAPQEMQVSLWVLPGSQEPCLQPHPQVRNAPSLVQGPFRCR